MVENLQVQFLPRMTSLQTMMANTELADQQGVPVAARRPGEAFRPPQSREVRESATFRLATFNDPRFVDTFYDASKCKPGFVPAATPTPRGPTAWSSPGGGCSCCSS